MTDVLTVYGSAVYSRLTTSSGTALWGTRVYAEYAPAGATLPYVRFSLVSLIDDNSAPVRGLNALYQVECWTENQAQARQGAGYIDDALHLHKMTVTGFTNFWTAGLEWFYDHEIVEGKSYFRGGRTFRIRLSE